MTSLQNLLDNHFQNLSSNLIYDTVKFVWKTCTQKSIEDMYIDACEQALQQIKPYLSKHVDDGELQFNRQDFRRILIDELNLDHPTYDLRQSSVVEAIAKAAADKDVLQIGGHTLSDDVYRQFVQQLLLQASNILSQTIHHNEEIFHQAIIEAHDASDEKARAILRTLSQQYEVIMDMREKIIGMDSKIDTLVAVQRSRILPDVNTTNQSLSRSAILQKFKSASSRIRYYKHTISHTNITLEQPETQQILEWILKPESSQSACLFTGEKGAGKSVVLRNVLVELENSDKPVVAIQASTIDNLIEELPASLEDCIHKITEDSDCVIIIDQLDNLADAFNRNQNALEKVLDLTAKVRNIPRARVVLACRKFEIKHDPILSTLVKDNKIKHVELGRLPDNEVNKILGYLNKPQLEKLSKAHQDLLTWSIFLDIYAWITLEYPETDISEFNSLSQLYQRYWDIVFDETKYDNLVIDECEQLVHLLVDNMQEAQEPELSRTILRKYSKQSKHLISTGFIKISQNKVSFLHQTLLAYCFARRFISTSKSVYTEIQQSPQSFFQRGQLIQVFALLRDSDLSRYTTELESFLFDDTTQIRFHLRQLLLHWLGKQNNLLTSEQDIILRLYRDESALPSVLMATRGNVNWLEFLKPELEPKLSNSDSTVTRLHYQYLRSFRQTATHTVIDLLYSVFGSSKDWDAYIVDFLTMSEDWTNLHAREMAFDLLDRELLQYKALAHMLLELANSDLKLACELLKKHLEAQYTYHQESIETTPDGNWYNKKIPFPVLDEYATRTFLEKLAEKQPELIVLNFLVWFSKVIHQLSSPPTIPPRYYLSSDIGNIIGDLSFYRSHNGINIIEAFNIAINSLSNDKDTFTLMIESIQQSEYKIFHDLVTDVLIAQSSMYAELGYNYIVGDPRRLQLERINELFEVVFPHLTQEQRSDLEQVIYEIRPRELSETSLDEWKDKWTSKQAQQYRLIYFIPENLLSTKARHFKYELAEKLKPYSPAKFRKQIGGRAFTAASPLTLDKLKSLSNQDYIRVLKRYGDSTDWGLPRDNRPYGMGGVEELSREVKKHATEDPVHLFQLSKMFDDEISEIYIAAIIAGIVESTETPAYMYLDILERFAGSITDRTRISICRSISSRKDGVIPHHLLEVIKNWITEDNEQPTDLQNSTQYMIQQTTQRTDGFYNQAVMSVRSSAFEAYCICVFANKNADVEDIYTMIDQLASDPSNSMQVMAMKQLGIYQEMTEQKNKTIAMMHRLIRGHEEILSSIIVQNMVRWLCFHDLDSSLDYLNQMLNSPHENTRQAASEIICVNSFHIDTLQQQASELVTHADDSIRKGAARIFARNLEFSTLEDTCLTHLKTLMYDENEVVRREVGLGFSYLSYDHFVRFHDFFREFIESPALVDGGLHLVLYLAKLRLTTEDDRLILNLANLIIEKHEQILRGQSWSRGISTKDFVMILRNVHNRNDHRPEIQSEVMDIFDKLLELNNYEVEQMVADEDAEWAIP